MTSKTYCRKLIELFRSSPRNYVASRQRTTGAEVHYYSADAKETIAKADEAYTRAFREFGIDVDTDVPSESAKKILDCSQSLEIVWAIDAWALNRKCLAMEEKNEEKGRMHSQWNPEKIVKAERLVQLAKLIDSDPWRCEFRVNACKPDYMMLLNKDQRNASAGQTAINTLSLF